MTSHDAEPVDFKPFFDLAVGLLFILLILIASQLFFTRWESAPSPAEQAARAQEARRIAHKAAVDAMLDEVLRRLREAGFAATVDRVARQIALPARQILDEAVEAPARVASALMAGVACTGEPRACAGPSLARIERIAFRLQAAGSPGEAPPETARVTGLRLAARLFEAQPALLGLRSTSGAPVLETRIAIEPVRADSAGMLFSIGFDVRDEAGEWPAELPGR